jgi:hypothetical protein
LIENLTKEIFAESVNTKFRVYSEPSNAIEIELVQLIEGVSTPTHEQFSLLFRGPQNHFLPQMTYHVEHDKLGEFDLFLVPVGKAQEDFQYEAVFNRFLQ